MLDLWGFFFNLTYFLHVYLIYSVGLSSAIQQSDSVTFFILFSIMIYHRIFNIVPCWTCFNVVS